KRLPALLATAVFTCISVHAQLKIIDRPQWVFPGQRFRICLQQKADAPAPAVAAPDAIRQFDHWDQGEIQRYYFEALSPGAFTLTFSSAAGRVEMPLQILSWEEAFEPRALGRIQLPRIWPLGDTQIDRIKTQRTMHTDADLEVLRRKAVVGTLAKKWLELSDDEVYNIIPGPFVPRTCLIVLGSREGGGMGKGCPICGTKIYEGRSGFYPWIFDPEAHPWKVGCPSCKTWFPSNDFHKGDMHSGAFPDDGFGCEPLAPCKDPNGRAWRFPFIAYYHQWAAYMRTFTPGILQCAQAYASTGDKRYAHKGAIALLKYAESMIDMSVNLRHRKIPNRDGILQWPVGAPIRTDNRQHLRTTFLYIQPNWDTPRYESCARAWDLLFDQLEDDAELLAFCQRRHHPEMKTIKDVRRFLDAGILRVPLQACLDKAVQRNYPQQETTAATLALALGTAKTMSVVDHLLNVVGVRFSLVNQYYKDGAGHESPSYNSIQIRDTARLFDLLEDIRRLHPKLYVPPRFVSPKKDPKFRLQYDFPLDFSLIGRTYAAVGDTGKGGPPAAWSQTQGFPCKLVQWEDAYRLTGDSRFAQAMYGPNGAGLKSIADPKLRAAAEKAGAELGWQVKPLSGILDGYGHAILRSGEGPEQRALWLRYARMPQHAHYDMLTYGLAAKKREWLTELGYPEGWTFAGHWESNWGTHYGTKIVGNGSRNFVKGELVTYSVTPPLQVALAESVSSSAKQPGRRERLIALVDVTPDRFYVVSLERVRGGREHIVSFHGPSGETTAEGIQPQLYEGTAAGEGIAYKDLKAARERDGELGCLALMQEPARAQANGVWSLLCQLRGQDGLSLRTFFLHPADAEIVLAKGRAPSGRSGYDITWVLLKRKAEEGTLSGQYLNILDPHEGAPLIKRIERLAVEGADEAAEFAPIAVRIHGDGFTDTLVIQDDMRASLVVDGLRTDGEVALWREVGGAMHSATLIRGTELRRQGYGIVQVAAQYNGQIVSCDWRTNHIVISPCPPSPEALAKRHIRLFNNVGSSASYEIQTAERIAGGCRISLRLDPRIGEGFVRECRDNEVVSTTPLRMRSYAYYAGKTLSNEASTALYRIDANCKIIPEQGRETDAATLKMQFVDADGDGLVRFLIYDYGPGDRVCIEHSTSIRLEH
ncbi:MAG: hypothetical protein KAI66_12530, partial [Lentisphaeria bacterium]|nr:hypothetical protein [Lentisphaeria bacterium]